MGLLPNKNTMKNYFITCKVYAPYPIDKSYREKASSISAATSRAVKKFKKELGHRRFEKMSIEVIKM